MSVLLSSGRPLIESRRVCVGGGGGGGGGMGAGRGSEAEVEQTN